MAAAERLNVDSGPSTIKVELVLYFPTFLKNDEEL